MKLLFLCYPKCDTCRKAQKWLDAHHIEYTLRNIATDNPSAEELTEWIGKSGMPVEKFFNTNGLLYKSMNLRERIGRMDFKEKIHLLASDGMLVKRPLVVSDTAVINGFNASAWEKQLIDKEK